MKTIKAGAAVTALFAVAIALTACGVVGGSGPSATHKAYVEAMASNDVPAIKKVMSKAALVMLEKRAQTQSKTLDDMLKEWKVGPDDAKWMVEERNVKITGDTATMEVRGSKGGTDDWSTLPFVKEDGEWKVALDKYKS
ncbi:MAG: nuclear transport factor 2 family protein [Pyrinomonadaceae bacterium]